MDVLEIEGICQIGVAGCRKEVHVGLSVESRDGGLTDAIRERDWQ